MFEYMFESILSILHSFADFFVNTFIFNSEQMLSEYAGL